MKKFNIINNKGITLVVLVITIIILLILVGVTINISTNEIKSSEESTQLAELNMIQHAVLERYTKASLTHESYPGIVCNDEDLNDMESLGIELKGLRNDYYKISTQNGFSELEISNEDNEYIVNYKTGEVFNLTKQKTDSGKLLYIYAREYKENEE